MYVDTESLSDGKWWAVWATHVQGTACFSNGKDPWSSRKWRTFKCVLLSERSHSALLFDSSYKAFGKRQNHIVRKQARCLQGTSRRGREGEHWNMEDLRKGFCMVLFCGYTPFSICL